nr:HPr(Ser) kinase/phosphatase [Maliibacterium massiliense]
MTEIIKVADFAKRFRLRVLCEADGEMAFSVSDINRPGLQFAGFFAYFPSERLQVLGRSELTYLATLPDELQQQRIAKLMSYPMTGVVVCRNMQVPDVLLTEAQKQGCPVFVSQDKTSQFIQRAGQYLNLLLAPRQTIHAGLVDINGLGVLLLGDSGIGKSETVLELVRNGHRMVSDDAVELVRMANNTLMGRAPHIIRDMMEIRGLGIVDVRRMYGIGAVMDAKTVDFVARLERSDSADTGYDRLGEEREYFKILDIRLPQLTIPVAPGRNIASIVEVAARHMRLQFMGFSAVREVDERLMAERAREDAQR